MRQRRTALKYVLSWERLQGSVGGPIHHSRSVRDQSRIVAHTATIPALVSPDGGVFLLALIGC